jgi:hypothetical protein
MLRKYARRSKRRKERDLACVSTNLCESHDQSAAAALTLSSNLSAPAQLATLEGDACKVGAGGGGAEEVKALKRAEDQARVKAVRLEEEAVAMKELVQEERAKVEVSKGGAEGVEMQSAMETLHLTAPSEDADSAFILHQVPYTHMCKCMCICMCICTYTHTNAILNLPHSCTFIHTLT